MTRMATAHLMTSGYLDNLAERGVWSQQYDPTQGEERQHTHVLLSLAPAHDKLLSQLTQNLWEHCKVAEQGLRVPQQGTQHGRLTQSLQQLWQADMGQGPKGSLTRQPGCSPSCAHSPPRGL